MLLWFEVFDTEPIYDTMTIFDGYNDKKELATLDGGTSKVPLESTLIRSVGTAILLHFETDAYRSFQGFTAVYKSDQDTTVSFLGSRETLSPLFLYSILGPYLYKAKVEHETTNTTVRAMFHDVHPYSPWYVSHPGADQGTLIPVVTMKLNDDEYETNATQSVQLASGVLNKFNFEITACDQKTIKVYTIEVNRPADTEAHLSKLTYSTGDPSPLFSSDHFEYNASVIFEIDHVYIVPTSLDPDAQSIWVGVRGTPGQYVDTGTESMPVMLKNGETNIVDLVVMAEDGEHSFTYTNRIFRPRYSLSQFERKFFEGEWRRQQYRDVMLMTLGGNWDPCTHAAWYSPSTMTVENQLRPPECRALYPQT